MYRPTAADSAPVWQAHVEVGKSKDERNARLDAAPPHLRERIRDHVVTAFLHHRGKNAR